MFCIAAFIVLVIISIFSARYRRLAKKAWGCVARRLTFRPCDTKFKDELKSRLLAHVALKKPQFVKAASIGIEVGSFVIVALTVWSLYVVFKSGLNLYVYGTCNPANAASCSLGAEACSIETAKPSFVTSIKELKLHSWLANEFSGLGETIAAVPTRMQDWRAEDYLPANATYEQTYSNTKPTALDIFDPGCQYCRQLYRNQLQANFASKYNVSYIAYPIANPKTGDGYKFRNSMIITRYLEAMKIKPLIKAKTPADWQILNRIFTKADSDGTSYQQKINIVLNGDETQTLLQKWMHEMGYADDDTSAIRTLAFSDRVSNVIENNRKIVEHKVKTVKIPTLIFNGQRHGGVVDIQDLK